MKNDNDLLADMPVPTAFFKLAIPAIAAQLINILYNLVDKMFIGRIPAVGKLYMAADHFIRGTHCDYAAFARACTGSTTIVKL